MCYSYLDELASLSNIIMDKLKKVKHSAQEQKQNGEHITEEKE